MVWDFIATTSKKNGPKLSHRIALGLVLIGLQPITALFQSARAAEPNKAIETLQRVQPGNDNILAARQAAQELQAADPQLLPKVLVAMDKATPLGRNWLIGVAESLHRRATDKESLTKYFADTTHNGEARALVFEWMTAADKELRSKLLEGLLEDPSPEIRYAAISQALERGDFESDAAVKNLERLLESARHPDQVNDIIKRLKDKGREVIASKHFGFIESWQLIGPFDNVEQKAFDVVYPIEAELLSGKFDPKATIAGKKGDVTWKTADCKPEDGMVDLNELFEKEKGAIVYARGTFKAEKEMPCDIRLGCTNANKVWLNGQLILSNEVYHAGNQIDQYNESSKLKAGENVIVVKVCQNEQTEPWAQDWAFQLRVCDSTGKAIPPAK
jgi:hypothetical protein